jgi:hypothetical protein
MLDRQSVSGVGVKKAQTNRGMLTVMLLVDKGGVNAAMIDQRS